MRRDEVVDGMEQAGLVGSREAEAARETTPAIVPVTEPPSPAPHFVEWVKQELIERLGAETVFGGGLKVMTTLDPAMQKRAEEAAWSALPSPSDPEVALASLDHSTGEVRAMVGGRDFDASQFNLAVQSRRQPGSAFKTFVLVAALEQGLDPQTRYSTAPYSVDVGDSVWRVDNYAVFARLVMDVGPEAVADAAGRMGIESPLDANPAIALGGLADGVSPLEMASAYGTLASSGLRVEPTGILRVEDADGDVVYEPSQESERVLIEAVAAETSRILHDVVAKGTGTAAEYGRWVAGKTGTTQSHRDAWFVGYTDELVTGVWVGFPEGQVEMEDVHGVRVTGGTYPAAVWRGYTEAVQPPRGNPVPTGPAAEEGTVRVRVCRDTFELATDACPDVVELSLSPEQEPVASCSEHPRAGD